jgi:hypothetical protein
MILPFSTVINGKPTYFVEKIWHSILFLNKVDVADYQNYSKEYQQKFNQKWDKLETPTPKKHTIREDSKHRWKPGSMIDFFINSRTKDMFRFAPRVPVVCVQNIEIKEFECSTLCNKKTKLIKIFVDGKILAINKMIELAENDGFENVVEFLNYFPIGFKGKIIHWTNLKY